MLSPFYFWNVWQAVTGCCALPWDASLNGRGVGDWNPGRPMATPAETVDAYCVDWCKARCEALGADAKDAWRPEARLPSFHTIAPVATAIGRTDRDPSSPPHPT